MTAKQRIKRLEKANGLNNGKPEKFIVMYDGNGDRLAKFDGVEMTQAEAEAKAAALPDNVQLIHVVYASEAIKDGNE